MRTLTQVLKHSLTYIKDFMIRISPFKLFQERNQNRIHGQKNKTRKMIREAQEDYYKESFDEKQNGIK